MQMQVANCSMNVLYAHAAAVRQFRKIVPGGKISMNINVEWSIPFDSSNEQDQVLNHHHIGSFKGKCYESFLGHIGECTYVWSMYLGILKTP